MLSNKSIGGYFELELEHEKEYYSNYYRFNLARNAIAFFFLSKKITTVYIPSFTCNSVADTLQKNNIEIKYYNIKNILNPHIPKVSKNEGLLIINHFDLHKNFNLEVVEYEDNILIDNSHSFFNDNYTNTVYSPRKYFGITDGAYLKTSRILNEYEELPIFEALPYIEPLINRIEFGAEAGFESYKKIQSLYSSIPIMKMSAFSRRVLESINYDRVKKQREENFDYLHEKLFHINELALDNWKGLFCYPLLIKKGDVLRKKLIANKIYIPQYWINVLHNEFADSYENNLVNNLVHLPIDQRYSKEELSLIISNIV
jgi:hypothetical protein